MPAETIAERVARVRERIAAACLRAHREPDDVTLIVVTKGVGPEAIREAVSAGVRHLGENRVQEAESKRSGLVDIGAAITWHMIGHLQTNKVKTALGLFDIIHSVDSFHLAEGISRRSTERRLIFLEVNVAAEPRKYGFSLEELPLEYEAIKGLPNIEVRGLMTVAPLGETPEEARPHFRRLRKAAGELELRELSMGMSDDFEVAVEEGATHVRVGRAIFGERR